jgi:hypothetical protein
MPGQDALNKAKEKLKDPKVLICSICLLVLIIILIVLIVISFTSANSSKSNYGLLFRTYELAKRYNDHPNFKETEQFTDRGQRFFTTGFDYLSKNSANAAASKEKIASQLVNDTNKMVENISSESLPLQSQQNQTIRDTSINAESGISGTTYDSGENVDIRPEAISNSGQVVESSPVEGFGTLRYMNNFGDLTQQGLNASKIAQAEENRDNSVSLDQQAMAEKMGFKFNKK